MLSSRNTQSSKSLRSVNTKQNWIEMLSMRRKRNKLQAQTLKKKLKMKYNRKRRKRSLKSKNHPRHLKVNLVQKKKRKKPRKRNQRKLNLLRSLLLKLHLKRRKRKKSQLQLPKRQVDCKNHPAQLANFAHLHKAILTILETSEKSFRAAKVLKAKNRILKHSQRQLLIPQRQANNLNHLNSNKS